MKRTQTELCHALIVIGAEHHAISDIRDDTFHRLAGGYLTLGSNCCRNY
jgi:hypothetical protein